MAKTSTKRGGKGKDTGRRVKKKVSILNTEGVEYVDWKDANLLRRFMSDRAKIRARRVTGNDTQQQREVARAIKNAREMALLHYTNRVTTQRGRRDRDDRGRGERGDRGERPERTESTPAQSGEFEAAPAEAPAESVETAATVEGGEQ